MAHEIGDTPGKGTYKCTSCGWTCMLNDDSEKLPLCTVCGEHQHVKFDKID